MAVIKATTNKNKYNKKGGNTGTDDYSKSQSKTFDFSDGKFSLKLTIFQIVGLCLFISGVVWFIAAEWHFDIKAVNLENKFDEKFNQFKIDSNKENLSNLDDLEKRISDLESSLNNLKIKNSYLK